MKMTELSAEEYLELSRDDVSRAVAEIMKEFDFEKAARALKGCGWKYVGASHAPTSKELRVIAEKIVKEVIQMGSGCSIGSGPLEVRTAHYDTPAVVTATLSLKPVWKSAVYVDGRVIYAKKGRKFTSAKKTKAV